MVYLPSPGNAYHEKVSLLMLKIDGNSFIDIVPISRAIFGSAGSCIASPILIPVCKNQRWLSWNWPRS
jgi:hypothetical protein